MGRSRKPWSVIDRGTGFWFYKLDGWATYKTTGIRISYRNHKPTNRRQAEVFAIHAYDRRRIAGPPGATLREYLAPYYGPDCPHRARLATDGRPLTDEYCTGQRSRLDRLVLTDPIADLRVTDVTPAALEAWKSRQKDTHSARTINQALSALSGAFTEGVHQGALPYNPVRSVQTIRVQSGEGYGIFTPEELRAMFVDHPEAWGYPAAYRGKMDHRAAHAFGLLLVTIGERPSAVRRIEWRNYADGWITFPQVKDRRKDGRMVPLTSYAIAALDSMDRGHGLIFPGKTWFKKRFAYMMEYLGLPECDEWGAARVPYSLKYTLETELIDRGANPALVRDLMGHSHQRGAPETILTPVQARYRRRRAEKLLELIPVIESLLAPPTE